MPNLPPLSALVTSLAGQSFTITLSEPFAEMLATSYLAALIARPTLTMEQFVGEQLLNILQSIYNQSQHQLMQTRIQQIQQSGGSLVQIVGVSHD